MKTIRQWLEILPDSIKESAINNAMKHNKAHDDEMGEALIDIITTDSFSRALYGAFCFGGTDEGFKYWDKIANEYNY